MCIMYALNCAVCLYMHLFIYLFIYLFIIKIVLKAHKKENKSQTQKKQKTQRNRNTSIAFFFRIMQAVVMGCFCLS